MFLELDKIKKHLNIDLYFTDDDDYIMYLADVAEMVVEKHTDSDLTEIAEGNGGTLPPPLLHAMLLFIGDMYKTRETNVQGSVTNLPLSFEYILSLYKNYKSKCRCSQEI